MGKTQSTDWDAHLVLRDSQLQIVARRVGKEQTGDPQIAPRLAAPEERAALAASVDGVQRGPMWEDKAVRRAKFHRQTRESIEKWLASKATLQHSTLLAQDDAYTACREMGNGLWEARGVVQTTGP